MYFMRLNDNLNEAFGIGDDPDFIDRSRKDQFAKREHSLAKHPAFPDDEDDGTSNYEEKLASPMYRRAIEKLTKYTGSRPSSVSSVISAMRYALMTAINIEKDHKEELEALAVRLVTELPEFEQVKDAEEQGDLEFDVELTTEDLHAQLTLSKNDEEESDEDQLVNAINNIDAERSKRMLVNAMISGSAESYNYAFELYNTELARIDARLPKLYGIVMAGTDLGYWIMPDDVIAGSISAGGQSSAEGGESKITSNEGTPVIYARGMLFPILVHEIIKSLVEYLSYTGLPSNSEVRKRVMSKTDHVDYETDGLLMGPEIWNKIKAQVKDTRRFPELYDALVQLDPDDFNIAVRSLLKGGNQAQNTVQKLLTRNESMENNSIVRRVLSGESAKDIIEATVTEPATTPKPKTSPKTAPNTEDDPDESPRPDHNPWRKRRINPGEEPGPKGRTAR